MATEGTNLPGCSRITLSPRHSKKHYQSTRDVDQERVHFERDHDQKPVRVKRALRCGSPTRSQPSPRSVSPYHEQNESLVRTLIANEHQIGRQETKQPVGNHETSPDNIAKSVHGKHPFKNQSPRSLSPRAQNQSSHKSSASKHHGNNRETSPINGPSTTPNGRNSSPRGKRRIKRKVVTNNLPSQ